MKSLKLKTGKEGASVSPTLLDSDKLELVQMLISNQEVLSLLQKMIFGECKIEST